MEGRGREGGRTRNKVTSFCGGGGIATGAGGEYVGDTKVSLSAAVTVCSLLIWSGAKADCKDKGIG